MSSISIANQETLQQVNTKIDDVLGNFPIVIPPSGGGTDFSKMTTQIQNIMAQTLTINASFTSNIFSISGSGILTEFKFTHMIGGSNLHQLGIEVVIDGTNVRPLHCMFSDLPHFAGQIMPVSLQTSSSSSSMTGIITRPFFPFKTSCIIRFKNVHSSQSMTINYGLSTSTILLN